MSNSFIGLIDRMLSGITTLGESGPGSDGNEGVPCIPQCSSIIKAFSSDGFVPYPGHQLVGGSYPLPFEMQSVYFTTPADWAKLWHAAFCRLYLSASIIKLFAISYKSPNIPP